MSKELKITKKNRFNSKGVIIRGGPEEDLIYESNYPLKYPEVIGKRFGRLTVLDEVYHPLLTGNIYLLCQCDCGNWYINSYNEIINGIIKSCGCLRLINMKKTKKKNRKSKDHNRLRNIYHHMIDRCYNKKVCIISKIWW